MNKMCQSQTEHQPSWMCSRKARDVRQPHCSCQLLPGMRGIRCLQMLVLPFWKPLSLSSNICANLEKLSMCGHACLCLKNREIKVGVGRPPLAQPSRRPGCEPWHDLGDREEKTNMDSQVSLGCKLKRVLQPFLNCCSHGALGSEVL